MASPVGARQTWSGKLLNSYRKLCFNRETPEKLLQGKPEAAKRRSRKRNALEGGNLSSRSRLQPSPSNRAVRRVHLVQVVKVFFHSLPVSWGEVRPLGPDRKQM